MSPQTNNAAKVIVQNISKEFPDDKGGCNLVIDDMSFRVEDNQFVSIVGRSGCGKSTMLNIIAGLLKPTSGTVQVNNMVVKQPGLHCGMIFQSASLFPWLTAIENIEFGPRNKGMPKGERRKLGMELIDLVRLKGFEDKYPSELSGGMQQRVAIARAMAMDPEIILMDEPFGALDQLTREDMQRELSRIWSTKKKTIIFVTHSISEAIYLSDRVLVFSANPGRIKEDITIGLERPRKKSSAQMMAYYEKIYETIGE